MTYEYSKKEEKPERIFVNGMIFKNPNEKAPKWIKGHISIKVADLIAFLNEHASETGWVNIDMKESQKGSLYFELNSWKSEKRRSGNQEVEEELGGEIPF